MIMCNDISDRKLAEEELLAAKNRAEESDKFKTSLIRNISHEIRTPLNAILGFSELITDPRIPAEEKFDYVEILNSSSDQLLNTINNLVDISAIQAKITKMVINETDLNEILKGIYNQFHKKAEKKNISILIDNDCSPEKITVRTDRMRLFQILSHLVSNAIKYTWSGEVRIGYMLKDGAIEFHVSDTGIGIPPEFHSRVFENFFQIEKDYDRRFDGIGLGLSICKAYVELLGGGIWFSSEPGLGSSFFFSIPYHKTKLSDSLFEDSQVRAVKNYKILIVDDLESNRKYLVDLLRVENMIIRSAENGQEALEICREDMEIDAVLMDLKMPVMDGIEAAVKIREIRPSLTLIAQSAYLEEKEIALRSGFDCFISKPFTRREIISTIKNHIGINYSK